MRTPVIAVLAGGTSAEREVSLGSGAACAQALARSFPTRLFDVTKEALPSDLEPRRHVVFSTLHGTFGEDGTIQRMMDAAGIHYGGCDAASSALTMDKHRTKQAARNEGIGVAKDLVFTAAEKPTAAAVVAALGMDVVVKPNDQGSSVGLRVVGTRDELESALEMIREGNWLIEQRIRGRECSIGVLNGRAMGIVEVRPKSGVYDYTSKYTKGATEYLAPAPFDDVTTKLIQDSAERAYRACGCRDYARVDFINSASDGLFLLEINTLPGMKETSLLPMSARCAGFDFTALVREMITPALQRFHAGSR